LQRYCVDGRPCANVQRSGARGWRVEVLKCSRRFWEHVEPLLSGSRDAITRDFTLKVMACSGFQYGSRRGHRVAPPSVLPGDCMIGAMPTSSSIARRDSRSSTSCALCLRGHLWHNVEATLSVSATTNSSYILCESKGR
jgi:hypothetical protein